LVREPFAVLDKYRIDYVLLQPTWPLAYVMEHSSAWNLIYSDKVVLLFERVRADGGTDRAIHEKNH
jgi:hypothetical protein